MTTVVRVSSQTLVGRDAQLRAAVAAVESLPSDRAGVVTVTGPAGIGKTRFVTALSDRLQPTMLRFSPVAASTSSVTVQRNADLGDRRDERTA
ncbi:MAG TPA: ATP-binding protein, partial [Euzebyales bacterium]